MSKVRKPVVAGYFYPSRKSELLDIIEWSFKHNIGPGMLPKLSSERRKGIIGYVVPHAGYIYSGPVAAHAYYDMAQYGVFDTIILLGTNHTGLGKPISVYPEGAWETPLGILHIDGELGKKIVEYSELGDFDIYAHIEEHSIEVQLPFIQYIYRDNVRILPIVVGIHNPDAASDLANAIYNATRDLNRDVITLASSDFNHYEPHNITVEKDNHAISKIIELNTEEFYKVIIQEDISICGPGGIMTLIELTKKMGGHAHLLKHATSGDISGDKRAVVGYASIKFQI